VTVRLAIANQKGGVGKTTTAVNLSSALAKHGLETLLIDLDPQANATSGLGLAKDLQRSTYDVLLERAPLASVVRPTGVRGLALAPSSVAMTGAETELARTPDPEFRLREAVRASGDYDFILVDCPPALGLLTVNALAACERALIPLQCEYYALEGLAQLVTAIELVRQRLNQELHLFGVLMTMEDRRNRLASEVIEDVRAHFPRELLDTRIPRSVRLAEAPSHGQPVDVYDPDSRGAQAYRDLATEILGRLEAAEPTASPAMAASHG
jgi:chromosome partitioning protein